MSVTNFCSQCLALWLMGLQFFLSALRAEAQHQIEIAPQIPHAAPISSVAFSSDGKRALSGSFDKTLRLWDVATGQVIRTFEGHTGFIWSVAISPDGVRLLSGSSDRSIKLWDATTGQLLRTFSGHGGQVSSLAFSSNGALLASGSEDTTLKLWDVATGELLRTFEGHTGDVRTVAFGPDGQSLLSASTDKSLRLWEAASGKLLRIIEGHSTYRAVFSPDGKRVLSGGNKTLELWDTASGNPILSIEAQSAINTVAFSPDGIHVIAGGSYEESTLKVWHATSGQLIRTIAAHTGGFNSIAFSPDGAHMLTGSGDRTLKLWEFATGRLVRTLEGNADAVSSIAFSPDAKRLLSGGDDKTIRLWDPTTGQLIRTFAGHTGEVSSLAFSPDGERFVSSSQDKTIKLWDVASGRLIRTMQSVDTPVLLSIAFSSDGGRLVSGGRNGGFQLWNGNTGQLLRTSAGTNKTVTSLAFSPDGTRMLVGSWEDTMELWEVSSGELVRIFDGQDGPVTAVAFSPDGVHVLSGDLNSDALKLWNVDTGELIRTFKGHAGYVSSAMFSSDGKRALSGSSDKTLKLWDTETGELVRTFEGHTAAVVSVTFSPDGKHVLSGSADTTLRMWDTGSGSPIATLIGGRTGGWLAMTPAGFFASSREVAKLVGIVRGLDVTTIDQVHQSLFSPDLVREALAGDSNGEVREAATLINLEKVLNSGPAPTVAIATPRDGSSSTTDLVTVKATIANRGKGIGRIEWRVNGVTAAVTAKLASRTASSVVTQKLALDPGDNTVEVVAYNQSNLLGSLPARTTIKLTKPTDLTKPKLHILAIGINAYVDKGWAPLGSSPLTFAPLGLAVKDARAFAERMKEAAKDLYGEIRTTLVLDKDATADNLKRVVEKMAANIHQRDSFMLFAAGHGTSEKGKFYLIPQDYQSGPGHLAKYAIGQDRLQDWLANRIKAKRAIILLDTCESGALVGGHARSRLDTPSSEAAIGRLHEATGRPVLTAAAAGQFAHEGLIGDTGERHGVFTWAVLDALRKGDSNGNGLIELSELVRHVQSVVPNVAEGLVRAATPDPVFGKQTARFGSRGEDFPIALRLH